MELSALHPYVRYVRTMQVTREGHYTPCRPYDARLFYTLRGSGRIEVDGDEYPLPPTALLYVNAGVPYRLLPADVTYCIVNFDLTHRHSTRTLPIPPAREDDPAFAPLEQVRFADAPPLERCCCLPSFPQAQDTLTALQEEYERRLPDSDPCATALLTGLLVQLLRYLPEGGERLSAAQVVDYVRRHYREELTGERLAQVFRYHPNHISAVLRQHTGRPLHRFLLETRIRHAMPLLEEGRLSVAEVAHAVGFADANYFTRYFKRMMGVTPLAYRRQGRAGE